jgi:hypothetical protein
LLDRDAQELSIEPLQHPSPPPAEGRRWRARACEDGQLHRPGLALAAAWPRARVLATDRVAGTASLHCTGDMMLLAL